LILASIAGTASAIAAQGSAGPVPDPVLPLTSVRVLIPTATSLAQAQALRDQAEALTPTEVLLEEHARERWLPRLAELEQLGAAPDTAPALRAEVQATLAALRRAGIGG